SFSIAENIALGFSEAGLTFPEHKIKEKIFDLSQKYSLQVDPNTKIWQLSVGEQQRVEILRALSRNARILILDEPTSVLTPQEVEDLFETLRSIVKEGRSIIFITHKLDEALTVSDRVTVLKDGKVVRTLHTSRTTKTELAKMMVGRDVLFHLKKRSVLEGKIILAIKDLYARNDKGLPAVKGVSLELHENEILGIAGVAGNGQRELVEVITGLRKAD
ncbi:MAG: ATP-binding cassette domain-containing protein, partial [Candidatus Aenigmarchaeota archaeon]|nr:ATP-binding cassette domain-containing protein [Candidatus Aenigmarchaeota archaeon]